MMVGVECRFAVDGSVRVRRVHLASGWRPVESGRQWLDDEGRHILIRLPDGVVRELVLQAGTLQWRLDSGPAQAARLV
jgi:hypothetical protein